MVFLHSPCYLNIHGQRVSSIAVPTQRNVLLNVRLRSIWMKHGNNLAHSLSSMKLVRFMG